MNCLSRSNRSKRMGRCAAAVVLLVAGLAQAWNSLGHRAVAELAWRKMTPEQRRGASDLLRHHPHYTALLTTNVPAGVDSNHWAFLTAAVWPDLVRPAKAGEPPKPETITRYNVHPHGVERPFLLPGETHYRLLTNLPVPKPRAEIALAECTATLNNPAASLHDRAVSLSWVLHLCGDLHQPLHCANLVSQTKPRERASGGQFLVRNGHGAIVNLHTFWDHLPGDDLSYTSVMNLADAVAADHRLRADRLPEYHTNRTIAAWVDESHRLAVDFAYAPSRVRWVRADAVAAGNITESDVPAVSTEYLREAQAITRRRLALAALRLSDALLRKW